MCVWARDFTTSDVINVWNGGNPATGQLQLGNYDQDIGNLHILLEQVRGSAGLLLIRILVLVSYSLIKTPTLKKKILGGK